MANSQILLLHKDIVMDDFSIEFRDAVWISEAIINVWIKHEILGWIPFAAMPDDPEAFGRNVFAYVSHQIPPLTTEASASDAQPEG